MNTAGSGRWLALGAIILSIVAIGLDQTVLNLALPTLAASLSASEAELQWFVTSYTLALAAAMLPAGLLGDRIGRKTVLIGGLVVFGIASIGAAYATSPATFIAMRTLLGLAGAALTVMSLAIVTVLFSEAERPRAIGIWAAANFLALPLGPLVGGWILANAWWGWVFLINVPITLIGFIAVVLLVPQSRSPERPGFDLVGIVASSAGLVAVMYGLIQAGEHGWTDASAIVPIGVGFASLAGFALWERRLGSRAGGQPLVDLALFRSRTFTWGMLLTGAGIFGLFGVLFTMPQYLQAIQGLDAQQAGLRFLPVIGGLALGAMSSDRVVARIGPKLTVGIGFGVLAVGMAVGATMSVTSSDAFIAGWTFLVGGGAALAFATSASLVVAEVPAERSGMGAGLVQTVIKLGPALGATILGSVLNAAYQGQLELTGLPPDLAAAVERSVFSGVVVAEQLGSGLLLESVRTAFVAGLNDSALIAAAIAAGAAVVALVVLPWRSPEVSESAAEPAGLAHDAV
jgi:MFS transporter, DHA2 family, multidrug resistance protein